MDNDTRQLKGVWPEEIRPAVEACFRDSLWIVPPWCQQVALYWHSDAEPGGDCVTTIIDYSYRWASIYVYAGFFDAPPEIRREHVLHEYCHIAIGPATDYVARD